MKITRQSPRSRHEVVNLASASDSLKLDRGVENSMSLGRPFAKLDAGIMLVKVLDSECDYGFKCSLEYP